MLGRIYHNAEYVSCLGHHIEKTYKSSNNNQRNRNLAENSYKLNNFQFHNQPFDDSP